MQYQNTGEFSAHIICYRLANHLEETKITGKGLTAMLQNSIHKS